MCLTPAVSITTAFIEFAITIYLFLKTKNNRLYPIIFFVFLLGFYQFTEFMLCTTSSPEFWAKIGFATYTFLPIFVYNLFINLSGYKVKKYLYIIPLFFSIFALLFPNFISYADCNYLHITVEKLIFQNSLFLMISYPLYYILFPVYGVYVFSKKIEISKLNTKLKISLIMLPMAVLFSVLYYFVLIIIQENKINFWIHIGYIIFASSLVLILLSSVFINKMKKYFIWINIIILASSSILIYFLYFIVQNFTNNFPSIFCQFALLYAVAAVLIVNSLSDFDYKK